MKKKHLVLAGGGHSHLFVLRALARTPLPDVQITLISPEGRTPYSGALSAWMSRQVDESAIYIDLQKLADQAGIHFTSASVTALDAPEHMLHLDCGAVLTWDVLSLNTGSTPDLSQIKGAKDFACPVKPVSGFMSHWSALLNQVTNAPDKSVKVAFIGAGIAGSELALTAANYLNTLSGAHQVHLFADSQTPAPGMHENFQAKLSAALARAGVVIHRNSTVHEISADIIFTHSSRQLFDYCFITTGVAAPAWTIDSGLPCDPNGFVLVNDTLQSTAKPTVFAAGDIAAFCSSQVPKSGVYAVRMGPPLATNLRNHLQNRPLKAFIPQKKALALLHTGQHRALATRGNWSSTGQLWWRLKHWLDRRFIRLFS